MAGLLADLSLGGGPRFAETPFYKGMDQNRMALSSGLLAMAVPGPAREKFANYANAFSQGGQMDAQRNQQMAEEQRRQEAQNQTVEWATSQFPQLAGAPPELIAPLALKLWESQMTGTGPDPTAAIQNAEYLISQGMDQAEAFDRAFSGGTTINNTVGGDGSPGLGKLSNDFGYVLDPETRLPVVDPATGLPTAAAIPGSPAALEAQAEAEAAANRDNVQTVTQVEQANTMLSSVSEALDLLQNSDTPVTGLGSRPFALSTDTPAGKFRSIIAPLKSGVAIGTMMRLKEASSTGATGFGQLNRSELQLLLDEVGALDPDTTNPDIMAQTLQRIQQRYLRVVEDIKANVSPERIQELGLGELIAAIDGNTLPPQITTDADYDALPSGATFMAPDGTIRRKP